MPLEPSHPDEPALHHALRDAFNARLSSTDFFVWIKVMPTGNGQTFTDLDRIVTETDHWLASLDPGQIPGPDALPTLPLHDPAAELEVRAIPKKRDARGRRAEQIVGNPEPILVGFLP